MNSFFTEEDIWNTRYFCTVTVLLYMLVLNVAAAAQLLFVYVQQGGEGRFSGS